MLILAAVVLSFAVTPFAAAAQRGAKEQVIILDGSKHPELFPQWWIWEITFRRFADWGADEKIRQRTGLNVSDFEALGRHAAMYTSRQAQLFKRLQEAKRLSDAAGKSRRELIKQLLEMERAERFHILEVAESLAREMSPAGLAQLRHWTYENTVKISKVHIRDLIEFRFPR